MQERDHAVLFSTLLNAEGMDVFKWAGPATLFTRNGFLKSISEDFLWSKTREAFQVRKCYTYAM